MTTKRSNPADRWGQLITAVVHPGAGTDRDAKLALAMSLGASLTSDALACSVTQATDDGYRTPVWSHQLALDLDEAQYEAGEGPCVDSAADGQVHTIRVMVDEPLYPAFTAVAVDRGVRCSLSLPLRGPEQPAALNLYAGTASAYDSARARATAELLAHCVGALLSGGPDARPGDPVVYPGGTGPDAGRTGPDAGETTADAGAALGLALERRSLVERAQQELIDRGAADSDQAYVQLTELSRTEQRSIFTVAVDLLVDQPPVASAAETGTADTRAAADEALT